MTVFLNNNFHFVEKSTDARIFVGGHYLVREANTFEDNVQGKISEHIFMPNGGLLCLLFFKYSFETQAVLKIREHFSRTLID